VGETKSGRIRLPFNPLLRVEFRRVTVPSDAGLWLSRELDEQLGLSALIEGHLAEKPVSRSPQRCTASRRRSSRQERNYQGYARLKTGGRLNWHARYFTLPPTEGYLTQPLFPQIVARIEQLAWHPTWSSGRPPLGDSRTTAGVSLRRGGSGGKPAKRAQSTALVPRERSGGSITNGPTGFLRHHGVRSASREGSEHGSYRNSRLIRQGRLAHYRAS
jgi:hypothetical protein